MISNITFLGGSGYICNSIRNKDFEKEYNIKFYSRRESKNCIKYNNITEIPKSKIIFDFSQRANGKDLEELGLSTMNNFILHAISKCQYYIFVSTLSIDINKKCNYQNEKYTISKLNFENLILSDWRNKTFILRIPSCFNNTPKESSLIKLICDRFNGSNEIIKHPEKFTSGIESQDIFDFVKILIKKPDIIPSIFGKKRLLRLGDGFAYQIEELEKFLNNYSKIDFDLIDNSTFSKNHKINLMHNKKWYLQPISFPVKLLKTIKNSQ